MNMAFVIIVILAAAFLWLLASFLYKPIGTLAKRLFDDARDAIISEEDNENKK